VRPLFVDEPELEATDRESVGSEDEADEQASADGEEEDESAVEGWQGVESDRELEMDTDEQHDIGSD
jgi:hypothetical protein